MSGEETLGRTNGRVRESKCLLLLYAARTGGEDSAARTPDQGVSYTKIGAPRTHLARSLRQSRLAHVVVLGELVVDGPLFGWSRHGSWKLASQDVGQPYKPWNHASTHIGGRLCRRVSSLAQLPINLEGSGLILMRSGSSLAQRALR